MQILADVYIAPNNDYFAYNPVIGINNPKNLLIKDIPDNYNNPKIVYCYTNCLTDLYDKLDCFANNFVLISGNSDENIIESNYKKIAKRNFRYFEQVIHFLNHYFHRCYT